MRGNSGFIKEIRKEKELGGQRIARRKNFGKRVGDLQGVLELCVHIIMLGF